GETGGLDIGEAQEESYQDDLAVDGTEGKGSPARKSDVYRLKKVAGVLGIDEWDVKHLVEIGRLKPVTVAGQHSGTTYFAREDVLRLKAEKVEADIGRKVYTRSQATQVLGGDKTALQRGVAKRTIRTYHDRFFDMEDINTLADELGVTPVIDDSKSLGQEVEAALAGIEEPSNTLNQVLEPPATQKRVYSYNQARDALDVPPRDFHNVLIAGGVEKVAGGYDADQIDELAKKRRERIEACVVDQKHGEARQDREPARLPTTLAQPEATKTRRYTEDQAASALCVTEGIFRSLAEVNNIPFEDGGYDADRIDRLKRELEKHNTTRVTEQNVNQPQNSHIKDIARKYGVTRSQADKLLREGGVERSTVTYYPTKEADELFSRLGYKPVSEGSDAGSRKATDLETDAQKVLEAIGSKTDGPVEVAPSKGVGLYSLGETAEALQMDKPGVMALVNGHKIRMKIVDGKICFERGEVARFGSEHGIEVAYVNQNIPAPKPEPIISDIGSTVIVENQDAPDPSAEDFDDSVSVESLAAPSAEELDDGAGEVLGAVGDGLVSALDGTNGLTLVEDVDVVDEDAQITPDDSKHIYTDSPLVTAWTGEKGSCKLYDIEMFYGLTRADVKDRLKEAGLWTAKPSQTFNRRDVAEKFAEAGIEPNPFVGLPAITDRERANLGRPPKAPEVPRDQTPERSRGEETEYRRPDGKHEQPTGQPRPHDIQRKYGLGAKEAHDLLQDNGIAPDVTISETVGLYSQDRVDGFFESRGIRPVGDSDKRDREAAVLPSIDAPVAESGVRKKIEPVGGRQQGVDKPAAQQALQKPEEMSTEKTHDRKIIDKPSPPVGFYGASKVYTPPPRVPDIYKPLRDSILSRLERERHTYFGVVDKSDIAQVLKAGGSMVSDSGTVFVAPDQVERVFGHGYERLRAMLAWQGLETDPIKGVNSEHMRKFIERDITKLNPKIADRMLVEFGYKQDVASVGGGVSECVDVNSDDVKDVIGCVQELTPHISPPVKADVEKPETENTGNNSIIDQGEPDLKIDDKPSLLGQKGKDEKSDEERDYQGEYYKGAFKGSVSLGKLRSIIGDRKTADRIGERYGQDGRVDNSVLARLASGLEDSELGAVQRERILLDMGIPTDTERAKGIVERYCPEIRHADRRREVVVFDPMEDYTLGDYSRMGLKREELDLIKKGSQGSVPGWRAAEILVSGWQLDVVRSTFGYSGNVGEIRGRIDKQKADYGRGRRS
ncbi:MAG TPA: hypothetical protein VJA47_04085, partial [archaeon]|nr:hypothetical protein [archaeon]